MHFNTKHIFQGDTEKQIRDKINYNFDQILSFAVGPKGHQGPKGSEGIPGPGGKKGLTGTTGTRGTVWYKQNTQPSNAIPYDLWIDSSTSDYDVYSFGTTGSWLSTGYSLFDSNYFSSYNPILGPAGATDKYAIGIKNGIGLLESTTDLVISDSTPGSIAANPNRAKLFVLTEDQTDRPVFTFSKNGSFSSGVPSFYWRTLGSNTDLKFTSNGGFLVSSLFGITIDSYTASTLLTGNSASFSSVNDLTIGGTGNFYMYSNTTVGVGGNTAISASNMSLSSVLFTSYDPIKIYGPSGASFVYSTTKNLSSSLVSTDGINLLTSFKQNFAFQFSDLYGANVFEGRPRGSGISSPAYDGKLAQTILGSTGGKTGGATGAPFFYHVKKVKEIRQACTSVSNPFLTQLDGTSSGTIPVVYNVIDLSSPAFWDNDILLVTPTSYTNYTFYGGGSDGTDVVYIKIPTSASTTLSGVYSAGSSSNYRIILNDIVGSPNPRIYGILYDYYRYTSGSLSAVQTYLLYLTEPSFYTSQTSNCYIDIFYAPIANLNNSNPRIFWKTCTGNSGYMTTTNRFSVGSVVTSLQAPSGGVLVASGTAKQGSV